MIKISEKEYKELTAYIKRNYGINLKEEKKALVTGRLHNILLQKDFRSFTEYYDYLITDQTGEAIISLINKITTNHTFFMREANHFYYLRDRILPYLENGLKNKDLRIWSAGCSSGEEPYTLAMILADYFGERQKQWDTKILATDISQQALGQGRRGQYPNEEIISLPPSWRKNYFQKLDNENSVVIDQIKNEIIYRKFNLMEPIFPFKKKFHIIFCRNVMIYFDLKTKKELVSKFYDFTEPGGYLFIGHSESLNREETKYKYILPAIYRKE